MKISELYESATSNLYHYTGVRAALSIVQNGKFDLSISTGSKTEKDLSTEEYDYFLSASRTLSGDYHARERTSGVLFNLDGQWLSSRYRVKPVDYWAGMWRDTSRSSESEERVFSKSPSIPIDAVTEVHVLITEDKDRPYVRKLVLLCKQREMPVFVYTNYLHWRSQARSKSLKGLELSSMLTGAAHQSSYYNRPPKGIKMPSGEVRMRSSLADWITLIKTPVGKPLPKTAEKVLYNIRYYTRDQPKGLNIDISNARKPSSREYPLAMELIGLMQKHHLDVDRLVKYLSNKWLKK